MTRTELNIIYEKLVMVREFLENELEPDELISKEECIEYVTDVICAIDDECIKRTYGGK